jgi:hypothetical protein
MVKFRLAGIHVVEVQSARQPIAVQLWSRYINAAQRQLIGGCRRYCTESYAYHDAMEKRAAEAL